MPFVNYRPASSLSSYLASGLCSLAIVLTGSTWAEEFEVGQHNKKFSTSQLQVKVGDTIHFTNQDSFFHNIYSLSETQAFDLGSYPKGQHRSITAKKAGAIDVKCAIHPHMKMTIEVSE